MITLSIDVKLLDKARFKPFKKRDGTEALYCELILIPTPNSEYGDYIVKQSVTKEERLAGKQLPILGNAKELQRRDGGSPARDGSPAEAAPAGDAGTEGDDVPF